MTQQINLWPADDVSALLSQYQPQSGITDELLDPDGQIRPVWRPLLSHLAGLSQEDMDLSHSRGRQYLRDAGVFFRQYGPKTGRQKDWPLSHLPLLVTEADWETISRGLMQRADILEHVMADIYGPQNLIKDGILPPRLVAQNPEWLRPVMGLTPKSGHYLHFIAFDVGRGPNGDWWVLGDRTQAPSGAAFALETRLATARMFPDLMARTNVKRLASFFKDFRDSLLGLRDDQNTTAALLSPGPMNDTYFEHAYIARYLGMLLVQGEDLVVDQGQLKVRSVLGLHPVSILWRRLDSKWLDPLELEESSRIGTPGLMGALRAQSFTMINAAGSGALEIRALMAFMPVISKYFTGEELSIPNIATWWCGDSEARDYVKRHAARMTIDKALSTRLPFDYGDDVVIGGKTLQGGPVNPGWIDEQGETLSAQEIISLSTTPSLSGGVLTPRPVSLRVFLARTASGWSVMPGGLARIAGDGQSGIISMQRGSAVSDVWVVSDTPVQAESLLPTGTGQLQRNMDTALLSRSADNLFWIGRYIERAEQKIRLLRAYHLRLAEAGRPDLPLAGYLSSYASTLGVSTEENLPAGLMSDIRGALNSAGNVRDRFSTDGWNALSDLQKSANEMSPRLQSGDDTVRAMSVLLRKISGFQGLVHENMHQSNSWRFLNIGRAIERAWYMTSLVSAFTSDEAPDGGGALVVEAGDSVMTHQRVYAGPVVRETVIDLLILDTLNPRSVSFQILALYDYLSTLPDPQGRQTSTILRSDVSALATELSRSGAAYLNMAELEVQINGIVNMAESLIFDYLR